MEFDSSSSLREQLEMAAGTGLYVSVHTSNLANALWLPPGAAVVEILQRNWAWEGQWVHAAQTGGQGIMAPFSAHSAHTLLACLPAFMPACPQTSTSSL